MTDPEPYELPAGPKERIDQLIDLLTRECGELTEPEKELARAVVLGEWCDLLREGDEELKLSTEQGAWYKWGEYRVLRAEVLRTLCVREDAQALVDPRGVQLLNARISGELNLEGACVPFDLVFGWCAFEATIIARGARVQTVNMEGSHAPGITANGLEAQGCVYLRDGFHARGEVSFLGAKIGEMLYCSGGRFCNKGGLALSADRLDARGGVFLGVNFEARGMVRLVSAHIGRVLDCTGGRFLNHAGTALTAQSATIDGALLLHNTYVEGVADLTGSRIGSVNDGPTLPKRVLLGDCRYEAIHAESPLSSKDRLIWVANHDHTVSSLISNDRPTDPQPYRWLASVLRKQGHERDADKVMQELGKRRRRPLFRQRWAGKPKSKAWACAAYIGSLAYGVIVGHGYARFRPLLWLAGFWVLGSVIFALPLGQTMQPSQTLALRAWSEAAAGGANGQDGAWLGDYPKFNPIVYSIDAFLPLVDFHQEEYWTPRNGPGVWRWLVKNAYLPLHIIMGWVIATLFAASFTKLARHD